MSTSLAYQTPPVRGSFIPMLATGLASIVAVIGYLEAGPMLGYLAYSLFGIAAGRNITLHLMLGFLIPLGVAGVVAYLHVMLLRGVFAGRRVWLAIAIGESILLALVHLWLVIALMLLPGLWSDPLAVLWLLAPFFCVFVVAGVAARVQISAVCQAPRGDELPASSEAMSVCWYLEDAVSVSAGLAWLLTTVVFVAPYFLEIFKDFRTNLPALTEWIFALSARGGAEFGGAVFIGMVVAYAVPVPVLIYRLTHPAVRRERSLLPTFALSLLVSLVLVIPVFVGLLLPFIKLVQAV